MQTIDELYREVIDNLAVENHKGLKACKKRAKALTSDIEDLKSDIYYFIRSIEYGNECMVGIDADFSSTHAGISLCTLSFNG